MDKINNVNETDLKLLIGDSSFSTTSVEMNWVMLKF